MAVPADLTTPTDPASEVLLADLGDGFARAIYYFAEVVDQHLDPEALHAVAETTPSGAIVTVTATSYVRDIVILADRADRTARVDRSLVSLLPGESCVFTLSADHPIEAGAALAPTVIRSANSLKGPPVGLALEPRS